MSIINELNSFAAGVPKENILKPLVESDILDVLVIGEAKDNYEYKILWEAMKVYCSCYGRNIKLHFVGEFEADESLKTIIHFYELDYNIEFIHGDDCETLLSYYLGCDFALLWGKYDENDEMLLKAQYFHLPVIVTNAEKRNMRRDGVLEVNSNPAEIAAAFNVLKNHPDYRKQLIADGTQKINEMEE